METNTLQVAAESPVWMHAGAWVILWLHIGGGTLAMIGGSAALAFRKGSRPHVLAGRLFFGSMIVMASTGAVVALFLTSRDGDPKFSDSLAGAFTCYLVATGWMTMRRRAGTIGRFEVLAFLFAASAAATAAMLGMLASQAEVGRIGGSGPQGYHVFGAIMALAAALDLNMILRGGLTGVSRLARHLWRLCLALFVALGSFFLGQQRVMPEWMQGSLWLSVPPLAALALMVFWLLKLRLAKVWKRLFRKRAEPAALAGAA